MRKLLKRWYVWLGVVLVLGLAGSVVLILTNPSRITQENFSAITCFGIFLRSLPARLSE
jgi:hypothetical protein